MRAFERVTDWTELTGFPKTFASSCAPWSSTARLVNGERETKLGKPVMLSGAKAFLQRLEAELIAGHRATQDVAALVEAVLAAHAKHIDVVEWCRVRDDELDLSLRVYASRGSTRLHLALVGPVGRYADRPLPERASAPAARARVKKQAAAAALVAAAVPPRLAPPRAPLVLRPITAGARPNYGDAIAFAGDGRLHVTLRLPDAGDYHYACVEPSGAVTLTPLPSREALRADDAGAMTGGLMPELHATTRGLVRIEHYDHSAGMKERLGCAGQWHASRRGLWDGDWMLGVRGEWFLRCIVHAKKATLVGAHLTSGKRTRLTLSEGQVVHGAALDRGAEGEVLRLLLGAEERRFRLRTAAKLEIDGAAATVAVCSHEGVARPVPNSGGAWVVAERGVLRLVDASGASHVLFSLPAGFTAPGYAPWGGPTAREIVAQGVDAPDAAPEQRSWRVDLDFGSDHGPRCTGTLVFTSDGAVLASAHVDADGALHIGEVAVPLGEGEHVCGYAAGPPVAGRPSGELAALLKTGEGLALAWVPASARK